MPGNKAYRDCRVYRICEGTAQTPRLVIAKDETRGFQALAGGGSLVEPREIESLTSAVRLLGTLGF
jgi:hypothetical protein